MRLIDADALKTNLIIKVLCELERDVFLAIDIVENTIDNAPTVDAVEVVRCKDCKHRYSSEFCECRPENDYCSDGERKEK